MWKKILVSITYVLYFHIHKLMLTSVHFALRHVSAWKQNKSRWMVSVQQKVVVMPQQPVIPSSSSALCGLSAQTTSQDCCHLVRQAKGSSTLSTVRIQVCQVSVGNLTPILYRNSNGLCCSYLSDLQPCSEWLAKAFLPLL